MNINSILYPFFVFQFVFVFCNILSANARLETMKIIVDKNTNTFYHEGKAFYFNELEINLEKDQMSGNNNLEEQIDQTTRYEYIEETEGGINEDNLESIQKDGLNEEELISPSSGEFYLYLGICFALTIMAAVMSGLTVGYLSIDELVLEMKMKSGTEQDRKRGQKILPVIQKHHWLMVALLVGNAGALEALPVFLEKIVPAYIAIIISVVLVLLFGEIIPQAVCTGPNQLKIAACLAPYALGFMWLVSPIAYPIAKALDCLLGSHHKHRYQNSDLKALIQLHSKYAISDASKPMIKADEREEGEEGEEEEDVGLLPSQTQLIIGALDLHKLKVADIAIPYKEAITISEKDVLNKETLERLLESGKSRFPVYHSTNTNNIVGVFRIKKLIGLDLYPETPKTIGELGIEIGKAMFVSPFMPLNELLIEFEKGKSHMAIVVQTGRRKIYNDTINPRGMRRGRVPLNTESTLGANDSQLLYTPPKFEDTVVGDSLTGAESTGFIKKNANIVLGIVTIEDVLERILKAEIYDEEDYAKENLKKLNQKLMRFSQAVSQDHIGSIVATRIIQRKQELSADGSFQVSKDMERGKLFVDVEETD